MPDTYKNQFCKALCTNRSRNVYCCSACSASWHSRCGGLKNRLNPANNNSTVKICADCLTKDDVAQKFPALMSRSNSVTSIRSNSKRLRQDDEDSINSDSKDESSDDDSQINEKFSQDPQLAILQELKSLRKSGNKKHNQLLTKIDSLTGQISSLTSSNSKIAADQAHVNKEIKSIKKDINKLNRQNIIELSFSGLQNSNDPNINLKKVVVDIAKLLQVNLNESDIRYIRILDNKEVSTNPDLIRPPTFIATFYSSSDCLKILDAKKNQRIAIKNKDIIQGSKSNSSIYINEVLEPETYKLLKSTRQWAKSVQAKYVWTDNGRILIRHKDKAKVHEINTLHDLADVEKYMSHYEEQIREVQIASTSQQIIISNSTIPPQNQPSTVAAASTSGSGSTTTTTAPPITSMETDEVNASKTDNLIPHAQIQTAPQNPTSTNNPNDFPTHKPLPNSILDKLLTGNILPNIL